MYKYNADIEKNKSNATKSITRYVIIGVIVLVIIIAIIVAVVMSSSSGMTNTPMTNKKMTNKPIAMHLRPGYDPEKQPYIDATGYKYYSRLMV